MEEVDSIIIHQLKEIGCTFENDYTSIKDFGFKEVVESVIKCISLIDNQACNDINVPPVLNMAVQYKLSNQLSNICSELGFRGDLGYQTFLYCSEHEIRKILSFLLEKISKDDIHDVSEENVRSENSIEKLINIPISLTWNLPIQNFFKGNSCLNWNCVQIGLILNSKSIVGNRIEPKKRNYYDNYAKIPINNFSSIIEWNCSQLNPSFISFFNLKTKARIEQLEQINYCDQSAVSNELNDIDVEIKLDEASQKENILSPNKDLKIYVKNLEKSLNSANLEFKELFSLIQAQVKSIEKKKEKLNYETNKLIEMQAAYKSISELKQEIKTIKEEIELIQKKWSDAHQQLISKLEKLKFEKGSKMIQKNDLIQELTFLRSLYADKVKELHQKDKLIKELNVKMKKPLPNNRSFYTKRIIEIVNNVKKQNQETKKILLETRQLQKDINNVSGKVQRAYTITDETIFKDAKNSEWNRKCYKLLATLHKNYDKLLECVNSIGTIRREILQLENLVENEKANKFASNLTQIQSDLNQLKSENQQLAVKLNQSLNKS